MFLPLTNLKLKENQNVDLQSFWVDLRKYLEIFFCPFLIIFGLKITSWHLKQMFLPITNLKLKENQNVEFLSFWVDLRNYLEISFFPVLMVFGL